jgi:hypothetical protein
VWVVQVYLSLSVLVYLLSHLSSYVLVVLFWFIGLRRVACAPAAGGGVPGAGHQGAYNYTLTMARQTPLDAASRALQYWSWGPCKCIPAHSSPYFQLPCLPRWPTAASCTAEIAVREFAVAGPHVHHQLHADLELITSYGTQVPCQCSVVASRPSTVPANHTAQ